MRGLRDRILDQLPTVKMPTIGKTVDVPVYVIHNSTDPEDYFFIFDFEQFVERSRSGMFVRPRLQVWAGRSDFGRRRFARQFRESFSREFESARTALAQTDTSNFGWMGQFVGAGLGAISGSLPGFIALIVLALATSVGSAIWSALPNRPRLGRTKSDEEKLEDSIADTQRKVDAALAAMDITVHPQLHRHAYRGAPPGPRTAMDADAWPLPSFVTEHLNDKKSTSWW